VVPVTFKTLAGSTAASLLLSVPAACVASAPIPLYDDIGIRLSGILTGTLVRYSGCYAIDTDGASPPVILILPRTTKLTDKGIALSPANGDRFIALDEKITLRGGYTEITTSPTDEFSQANCKGEAFLVNSVD
jgi:hypothetical protein